MKLKSAKSKWYGRVGFGLNPPLFVSVARFANSVEALFGLKSIAFNPGPFNSGRRLSLAGNGHVYELIVNDNGMTLGKVETDGRRIRLATGMDTKADWDQLLRVLQNCEGERRLAA